MSNKNKMGVSHAALALGMTTVTHALNIETAKPKPRTAIGKAISKKNEPIAHDVHANLRQIGLASIYALFTAKLALRQIGVASLIARDLRQGAVGSTDQDDSIRDDVVQDLVRDTTPMFQRARTDADSITFSCAAREATGTVLDTGSDAFTNAFSKLIPNYTKPVGYISSGYSNKTLEFSGDTEIDATISYDDLVRALQGSGVASGSPLFSHKVKLPKGVSITITFTSDLAKSTILSAGAYQAMPEGKGDLPRSTYATLPINVQLNVTLPLAWAMWATYSEQEDEFVPTLAMNHFATLMSTAMGFTKSRNKSPTAQLDDDTTTTRKQQAKLARLSARVSNVASAKRLNESRTQELGFDAKVRTNKDGFAILPNGELWYIPDNDNVKEYVRLSKEASTGEPDAPRFNYPSRILYIDPVNEVLVHTTTASTVTSIKLRGCKPLDDISSAKFAVRWALTSSATKLLPIFNGNADMPSEASFIQALIAKVSDKGAYANLGSFFGELWKPVVQDGPRHDLTNLFSPDDWYNMIMLRNQRGEWMIDDAEARARFQKLIINQNATTDIDELEAAEDLIIAKLHSCAMAFSAEALKFDVAGGFEQALPEGTHAVAITNTCRVALYAVTHLLPRFSDLKAGLLKAQRNNQMKPLDRHALHEKPIAIPNLDLTATPFVFPHQAEVIQNIDIPEPAKYTLIGGAPGFGKTITMMADMLLLLAKGKIKRPMVVVPNKLERQFIAEIQKFTAGKVNGFCATYQNLKDMQSPEGLNFSYEDTIKFLRELPLNTIIVTNYNTLTNPFSQFPELYEATASYDTVGTSEQLVSFPFVDIFYAAGVDYVAGDESHKIKNMASSRAQAFLAMCSKCDYVRLSSGTTVNNVVSDLVGQMQKINPLALGGSVDAFRETFLDGDKQVTSASQAEAITDAMRDYAMVIQKDSRSWAYMLPPLQEIYHRVPLTELQARYYAILFYKAGVNIKKQAEKKRIVVKDDADNDSSVEAENNDAQMETIAARHFGVIDRFVNSPDAYADFVDGSWTIEEENVRRMKIGVDPLTEEEAEAIAPIVPSADDLISQKAKWAYMLMYAHFDMRNKLAAVRKIDGSSKFMPDPDNKLITLSPYKITGTHLYDNMPADLKAMAVRYQANDFAAVERFKQDPAVKILIADEISITEGHNLQVASRTIRMQGVWTPGAETQALARTRRPDPGGTRQRLGYDVINATLPNGRPTIDDLRVARLLAKKLSNAKVEFGYERSFQTDVGTLVAALPPVTMSMDNIEHFPTAMLDQYFEALGRLNTWAYNSSKAITKQIGQDIEEDTGEVVIDADGRPLDLGKFVSAAVVKTAPAQDLSGSRVCYTPWVEGVEPINPLGFKMIPVRSTTAVTRDDADDDDEEEEDFDVVTNNVQLEIGDHVMTEYGPGIITRLGRRSRSVTGELNDPQFFWIDIPSMPSGEKNRKYKNVKLAANRIYVPANGEGDKTLRAAILGKKGGLAPQPKPISKGQKDAAKDRKAERQAEADQRNANPDDDGEFTDYDAPDVFDATDFDIDVIDIDEEDEEPADPIDILADIMDDDDNIMEGDDEEEDFEDDEEDNSDGAAIYGYALTVNGQLALLFDDEGDGSAADGLITNHRFRRIPDFARLEVRTKAVLDTLLAKLAKANYRIPPQNLAEINALATGLVSRGKLRQTEPYNFREITNFLVSEQRRVPARTDKSAPQTFRIYALIMRGKFYLAASISKHPFNVKTIMTNLRRDVAGTGKIETFEDQVIQFAKNKRTALSLANAIIAEGNVSNPDELIAEINAEVQGGLQSPVTKDVAPAATPATTSTRVAPIAKPSVSVNAPAKTDYKEGRRNPDVEDLKEFRTFLRTPGATMILKKGKALPIGVPYRVKSYNAKTFGLSNTKGNNDPETFEFFMIPTAADSPVFDNDAATMTIGKSVWSLSY